LGAAVAGAVPSSGALAASLLVAASCAAWGAFLGPYGPLRTAAAAAAALLCAELLLRRCVRRFGGVTGDVFGALAETATTTALVALTLA
ncbi:adenosylcobinamide-GDP ribazoletransferase, partial [Streptosporangium nondiastaticum]